MLKRIGVGGLGLATVVAMALGTASTASAAPFLVADFCPQNNSCPTGVTQARLSIEANTGTQDANDYFVTASFVGNASAPAFLDMFSFTITGANTPGGYTSVTLQSVTGAPGVTWATFYDNVSNQNNACTSNTNQANEVCTNSVNPAVGAPLTSNTLTFTFLVDLAGSFQIANGNGLNLRAAFNNANGSNAGILSPNGNYSTTTGTATTTGGQTTGGETTTSGVPEPAMMSLLGLGLAGAAWRARRRQ